MKFVKTSGLAAVAAGAMSLPAAAATVDLQSYVNANVSSYVSGEDYPFGSTTIGGIDFDLTSFAGGTGVVQLTDSNSVTIDAEQSGVDTAYIILNSAWGQAGANNGSLTFNGANGSQVVVQLVQGLNIRDHYTVYNNAASEVFATATYDGGNRFDVYRYDLGALGGNLSSIVFTASNATFPQGAPFIAAVTTSLEGSAGTVPEPATWALMILGFGAVGATARRRGHRSLICA